MPLSWAKAIQISGTRTPSISRQTMFIASSSRERPKKSSAGLTKFMVRAILPKSAAIFNANVAFPRMLSHFSG